jgi:hypothetical protein
MMKVPVQIRTKPVNDQLIKQIGKGDEITLELSRHSGKQPKFIKVKVIELTSDIERCAGCTCLLRADSDRYKFGSAIYCKDCYDRRVDEQKEITSKSAKLRKHKQF